MTANLVKMLLAVSLFISATMARSESVLDQDYPKIILQADIRETLSEFATDLGLVAVINPDVTGEVQQLEQDLTGREFIDRILSDVDATWYRSNRIIYVDPVDTITQRVFDVSEVDNDALLRAFDELEIEASQLPLAFNQSGDIAFVTGPERYLGAVTDLVALNGGALVGTAGEEPEAVQADEIIDVPSIFRGRVTNQ